ncbi:MAG TPA: DUF2235 domain-containing protein [Bryobacteraceae bacterium]|nr:DUF2235 domain-containing protein [Bryobacteraceae bacterium]
MRRNIALFIDGTGNNGRDTSKTATNVWKLHEACNALQWDKRTANPETASSIRPDVRHYIPGVGAKGGFFKSLIQATGFTVPEQVDEGYRFIASHYSPEEGDHIYLFGFSRGAFAARVLAGFAGKVGNAFLHVSLQDQLILAYEAYAASILLDTPEAFTAYFNRIRETLPPADWLTIPLPIHFVGVWDTVKSYLGRELPEIKRLPDHISFGRHALAIHERRDEMEPALWTDWRGTSPDRVIQAWFPGAHADVGGGYPESELSHRALEWIVQQCAGPADGSWGLRVVESSLPSLNTSVRTMHQTRTGEEEFSLALPENLRGRFEHSRNALTDCLAATPEARRLLSSFRVHQSACEDLLRPAPITFHESWSDGAEERAREAVSKASGLALRLYLELQRRNFRDDAPARESANPWWASVTAGDARTCAIDVTEFLRNPVRQKSESFGQALALFILLGGALGQEEWEILKGKQPHYGAIGEGLLVCRSRLEDCGAQLPKDLEKACPPPGVYLYDMPRGPVLKPRLPSHSANPKPDPGPS